MRWEPGQRYLPVDEWNRLQDDAQRNRQAYYDGAEGMASTAGSVSETIPERRDFRGTAFKVVMLSGSAVRVYQGRMGKTRGKWGSQIVMTPDSGVAYKDLTGLTTQGCYFITLALTDSTGDYDPEIYPDTLAVTAETEPPAEAEYMTKRVIAEVTVGAHNKITNIEPRWLGGDIQDFAALPDSLTSQAVWKSLEPHPSKYVDQIYMIDRFVSNRDIEGRDGHPYADVSSEHVGWCNHSDFIDMVASDLTSADGPWSEGGSQAPWQGSDTVRHVDTTGRTVDADSHSTLYVLLSGASARNAMSGVLGDGGGNNSVDPDGRLLQGGNWEIDGGDLDVSAGKINARDGYEDNGTPGVDGTNAVGDTVSGGIITGIGAGVSGTLYVIDPDTGDTGAVTVVDGVITAGPGLT